MQIRMLQLSGLYRMYNSEESSDAGDKINIETDVQNV